MGQKGSEFQKKKRFKKD